MGAKNGKPVLRKEDIASFAKSTGLSEDQIKQTFNEFINDHPNGKISKDEFGATMKKVIPDSDGDKMKEHIFRVFDKNGDGSIDFSEFMMVFHIMQRGTPQQILSKLFHTFDINGDGLISKLELQKLVNDINCLLSDDDSEKVQDEMLAVAWKMEEDGNVNIELYIQACLAKDEFGSLLKDKIMSIFSGM